MAITNELGGILCVCYKALPGLFLLQIFFIYYDFQFTSYALSVCVDVCVFVSVCISCVLPLVPFFSS